MSHDEVEIRGVGRDDLSRAGEIDRTEHIEVRSVIVSSEGGAPVTQVQRSIAAMIALLEEAGRGCTDFASACGLAPIRVVYEALIDRDGYREVITRVLSQLGLADDAVTVHAPRTRRQSDDLNDGWVDRFIRDHSDVERPA